MKFTKSILCLALLIAACACIFAIQPAMAESGYQVVKTMTLGGDGGWDYIYVDAAAHRAYVARATHFQVVDLESGKVVGDIPDTKGAHGVAIVPDLGIGFTSNGRENSSSVFDPKTLQVSEKVKTGEGPDAIIYEPFSKMVYTMNGHGKSSSVIDPKTRKVVATITLSGKPETPVSDGKGRMYINIEDKNSLAVVDVKTNKVVAEWPMAGCDEPTGLDMDRDDSVLFASCGSKVMAIVDAKTGKMITTVAIGDESDGLAYDAKSKVAVSSNGEGNMTFVGKKDGKYAVLETVSTKKGARTIAFDPSTNNFLTASADLGPAPKPSTENPRGRPMPLPNSFVMIAVGKK